MDDLKLLYITSKIRALVSVNQSPVGETGESAITQIASGTSFMISVMPLENDADFIYIPYSRRISTAAGGSVSGNDGLVEMCFWPGNIIEIILSPLTVLRNEYSEFLPSVVFPYDFIVSGERHTAYIYNETYSSFAVENTETKRLVFFRPFPFSVRSAEISLDKSGEAPVLIAAGETTEEMPFIFAAGVFPAFRTAVCTTCISHSTSGGRLEIITQGPFLQVKTVYEKKEKTFAAVSSEPGWFTCEEKQPSSPEEAIKALIQAVDAGAADTAMRFLTPSLSEGLSFTDLKEFFGDFVKVADPISPACGRGTVALKYAAGKGVYTAREFCVDTKSIRGSLLIDNIREP